MTIDVSRLGQEALEFGFTFAESEVQRDAGVRYPEDVRVSGAAERHAAEIRVSGRIEAKVLIDCTRCLEPVEKELNLGFDVSYVSPEHFAAEKETELKGEDLKVGVLDGNLIDVRDIVREQLLLEMPEQVFCSEDCKGLCDHCGINLNTGSCSCKEDDIDPRWAALKNLK